MRQQLKAGTARAHDRVDAAFSGLSLADRQDFIVFLRAHELACRQLRVTVPAYHWIAGILAEVIEVLRSDLSVLNAPVAEVEVPAPAALDPLGVAYVVCGSHFGKAVLRGRWRRSTDPIVLRAGAYLDTDVLKTGWRHLMQEFDVTEVSGLQREVICADAERTFDLFHDSLCGVQTWEASMPCDAPKLSA